MKSIFYHRLLLLLKRIVFVILLYVLMRNLLYSFNRDLFAIESIKDLFWINIYGLRFDIAAVLITNVFISALYLIPVSNLYFKLINSIIDGLFVFINSIAIVVNISDIAYFRFTLKRTTFEFINMFTDDTGMFALIPTMLKDFWYLTLIGVSLIILLIIITKKTSDKSSVTYIKFSYSWKYAVLSLLIGLITTIGMRGGIQLRPIGVIDALQYVEHENTALVINTTFSLMKSSNKTKLKKKDYFTEKELAEYITPIHYPKNNGEFRPLNIVIIIMESMSKEHSAFLNPNLKGKGFTPFLDSLMKQSLFCTQAYANGRKSIEGIPAVLASFPTLFNDAFISSNYSSNNINSLASILGKKGYSSSFYHGGNNGTMGFDNFTNSIGFENYYGREEYNNDDDFDGKWGIFDHKFFDFFEKSLNEKKQPFLAAIFSLSAHHPYTLPLGFENKFPKGEIPIQQCIAYSDYSLMQFFKKSKNEKWFENTLFIITADHTSEISDKNFNNSAGRYAIPIIFYMPNDTLEGEYSNITQQLDIMPSVLDYLNYDDNFYSLGNSIFNKNKKKSEAISYNSSVYQYISGDSIYNLSEGTKLIESKINPFYSFIKVEKHEPNYRSRFKAIVQEYNQDIIENKMNILN